MEQKIYITQEKENISLCDICIYKPEGKGPISNQAVRNELVPPDNGYCSKMGTSPMINYSDKGEQYFDVAACDGFEKIKEEKPNKKTAKKK